MSSGGGGVITSIGAVGAKGGDRANALTLNAEVNLYVAGYGDNGSNADMMIWKFDSTGAPDTSFGVNGVVVSDNAAGGNGSDLAFDIVIGGNGQLYVIGSSSSGAYDDMVIWNYRSMNRLRYRGFMLCNGSL